MVRRKTDLLASPLMAKTKYFTSSILQIPLSIFCLKTLYPSLLSLFPSDIGFVFYEKKLRDLNKYLATVGTTSPPASFGHLILFFPLFSIREYPVFFPFSEKNPLILIIRLRF